MMSIIRHIGLQPELVQDVMEELMDSQIISTNNVKDLKRDYNVATEYDPNAIMDARHEKVKNKNLEIFKRSEAVELVSLRPSVPDLNKMSRQMASVDREIERFKRELESEREKLFKISNRITRTVSTTATEIKPQPAVPVINVVTQLKQKTTTTRAAVPKKEMYIPVVNTRNSYQEMSIEILGYKPLNMVEVLEVNTCVNNHSSLCTHSVHISEVNSNFVYDSNDSKGSKYGVNQIKKKEIIKENNENEQKESTIKENVKKQTLINKAIRKWRVYVDNRRQIKYRKSEELIRIKRRKQLLQRYFNDWYIYYRKEKEERVLEERKKKRMERLDDFLDKLEQKKKEILKMNRVVPEIGGSTKEETVEAKKKPKKESLLYHNAVFVNRLNAQKSIIYEQKAKIEEQNRLIEELKLKKLNEEIKEFDKTVKENVLRTLSTTNRNLKPSMKSLANNVNVQYEEAQVTKYPDFLQRMNERAEERREKWKIIKEKKEKMEEEKQRKLMEEEKMKVKQEEQEKRRKIQERKDKERLQKELELRRIHQNEEYNKKMEAAKNHYRESLLRKTLYAFVINVEQRQESMEECTRYYEMGLLKQCLKQWQMTTYYSLGRKMVVAETFWCYNLLQRCWDKLYKIYEESVRKMQVAEDFYDTKLLEKSFVIWRIYHSETRMINKEKMNEASDHYEWKVKRKYFSFWKQLPKSMLSVRQKEQRMRVWRDKIQEILPDFTPDINED